MLKDHSLLCTLLGKCFRYSALAAVALALLPVGNAAWAKDDNEGGDDRGAVRLLKTVPIPGSATNTTNGKLYAFDISFVDQSTQTYYLADRSNAVVDVVDAKTGTFVKQITGASKGWRWSVAWCKTASPVPTASWPRFPGSS